MHFIPSCYEGIDLLMNKKIQRGDMFYADLTCGIGSEQNGYRPVLIIQNNIGNKFSNTVIIAIITSRIKEKTSLPTHCYIKAQQGLERDSLVLLEQIRTIDKARLEGHIGALDYEAMRMVNKALSISIGLFDTA